jgi:glyoxylase-like metal-dependent hydrolase (beta-lactamase superfamily II)
VVLADCGIQLSAVKKVRREIEELSKRKVEIVILTHFHSDHICALPAFSDCRIVASNLLLKNLKRAGRKVPGGFRPIFPSETFDRQLEFRDGNVKLVIKQTGGHTDCSTFVFCPSVARAKRASLRDQSGCISIESEAQTIDGLLWGCGLTSFRTYA